MKIIDAHFHFSQIDSFIAASHGNGVDYSLAGFKRETAQNNIVSGICMGVTEGISRGFPDYQAVTPMGADLDKLPAKFYFCAGINPLHLSPEALTNLEQTMQSPDCVGIKFYAGYYHFMVTDAIYAPVVKLALKYNLPVVIHSGDTYSDRGLLKYSHPLAIDELAVKYPDLKIVICHLGNPWLLDTAELVYKNKNVYADLSGLQVGDKTLFDRFSKQELYLNMFKTAIILADRYDKLIFGTDWPLAPYSVYIDFIKKLVPEEHWQKVFYDNALSVFDINV